MWLGRLPVPRAPGSGATQRLTRGKTSVSELSGSSENCADKVGPKSRISEMEPSWRILSRVSKWAFSLRSLTLDDFLVLGNSPKTSEKKKKKLLGDLQDMVPSHGLLNSGSHSTETKW